MFLDFLEKRSEEDRRYAAAYGRRKAIFLKVFGIARRPTSGGNAMGSNLLYLYKKAVGSKWQKNAAISYP